MKPSLRLVCLSVDCGDAAHVGGPVHQRFKTFDLECPAELVTWLTENRSSYETRTITGVELRGDLNNEGK